METKRPNGFYKVKRNGQEIIAEYMDLLTIPGGWFLTGNEEIFYDTDFEEIPDTPILLK